MIPAPRNAAALLVALAVAGCAGGSSSSSSSSSTAYGGRSHASLAAQAACRRRAEIVYNTQNRGDVYRADNYATNDRDSPFASTGFTGNTSAGLSSRYHRDQLEDDCLSSSGEGAPTPGADPTSGTPPPAASATRGSLGAPPPGPLPVPTR